MRREEDLPRGTIRPGVTEYRSPGHGRYVACGMDADEEGKEARIRAHQERVQAELARLKGNAP